jgi:tetratricopeptide (TPR) repeat protein
LLFFAIIKLQNISPFDKTFPVSLEESFSLESLFYFLKKSFQEKVSRKKEMTSRGIKRSFTENIEEVKEEKKEVIKTGEKKINFSDLLKSSRTPVRDVGVGNDKYNRENAREEILKYCGNFEAGIPIDDDKLFEMRKFRSYVSNLANVAESKKNSLKFPSNFDPEKMSRQKLCSSLDKIFRGKDEEEKEEGKEEGEVSAEEDDEDKEREETLFKTYIPFEQIVDDSRDKLPTWAWDPVELKLMLHPYSTSSNRSYSLNTINSLPSRTEVGEDGKERIVKIDPMNRQRIIGPPYENWNLQASIDDMLFDRTGFSIHDLEEAAQLNEQLLQSIEQEKKEEGKDTGINNLMTKIYYYYLALFRSPSLAESLQPAIEEALRKFISSESKTKDSDYVGSNWKRMLRLLNFFHQLYPLSATVLLARALVSKKLGLDTAATQDLRTILTTLDPNNLTASKYFLMQPDVMENLTYGKKENDNEQDVSIVSNSSHSTTSSSVLADVVADSYFKLFKLYLRKLTSDKDYDKIFIEVVNWFKKDVEINGKNIDENILDKRKALVEVLIDTDRRNGVSEKKIAEELKHLVSSTSDGDRLFLADTLFNLHQYEDALKYYDEVLENNSTRIDEVSKEYYYRALEGRAEVLDKLGRPNNLSSSYLQSSLQSLGQ